MPDEPFVIAGAGIAGLALAAALRVLDLDVRVLEERPAVSDAGGAITLWPNALAALDAIGLGDDVRRAGHAVSAGEVRTHEGRLLRRFDEDRFTRALGEPLLAVRRGVLVELLAGRVDPGAITTGVRVTGYTQDPAGVAIRLGPAGDGTGGPDGAGPATGIVASALVGADGYRSAVARALGGPLAERYAGYPAWRGIAAVGGHEGIQLWGRHQEFGVVPLGPDSTYWYATVKEPAAGTAPEGEIAHLQRAFAGWPDPVASLLAATPPGAVSRSDICDRAAPARWHDGAVTVIGDAAHAMRPHLGQGGCQALVDAAVLAARLRAGLPPAAAFAAYSARRRRQALAVVRTSRLTGRVINGPAAVQRAVALLPDGAVLARMDSLGGRGAFRG